MTTVQDHGDSEIEMLHCDLDPSNIYPTLVLALRDMRSANGRNVVTGAGSGNDGWAGLTVGMVVLDTLSGEAPGVRQRFTRLLTGHAVPAHDASIIWALRCSILHGYGLPKPVSGKKVLLTGDHAGYAVDTSPEDVALVSVPVFCARLVERMATEAKDNWDVSLLNTDYRYPQ
jgi:hypothetical protein